jgi:hypothetical protein
VDLNKVEHINSEDGDTTEIVLYMEGAIELGYRTLSVFWNFQVFIYEVE